MTKEKTELLWTSKDNIAALETTERKWIPNRKNEDWRYLDPKVFPWEELQAIAAREAHVEKHAGVGLETTPALPTIKVEELRELLAIPDEDRDAKFLYLHRALSGSRAAYRIPADLRAPVQIIQRVSHSAAFTTVLFVESGADAVVCNRWESESDDVLAAIGRIEIVLSPGARLHFLHEDHFASNTHLYRRARARIAEGASLQWGYFTVGSEWNATKTKIELHGADAESTMYGLFCGAQQRKAEFRTLQYHAYPQAKSNLFFKSLLSEQSRSVFQGMIRVDKEAQRTDAYQTYKNLLLSSKAHALAIPRLEILADNVHCSHGATMGTVDDNMLFYLMTRGLSRAQATAAIATGFAEEIIRRMPLEDAAERWRDIVRQTINGGIEENK